VSLSALWDGELHQLTPGEHFNQAPRVVLELEEVEEEEPLDPYETPSQVAMVTETGSGRKLLPDEEFSQGFGTLSMQLHALAMLLGGTREQFQHNQYDERGHVFVSSSFTFQYKPGDNAWVGERL
jgi:hypothetical protein